MYDTAELVVAVTAHRQLITEANMLESRGYKDEADDCRDAAAIVQEEIAYWEDAFGYHVNPVTGTILRLLPETG